jgi:nitric oxide reductase subunit C
MSYTQDPAFWRAGAIATCLVMGAILFILTVNSYRAISPGGSHVPEYDVINLHIDYKYDSGRRMYMPVVGGEELLFGHKYTEAEAAALVRKGKIVIQSRACMDCHTFFGNGAYYAPDLTKSWLDPVWEMTWKPMYGGNDKAEAIVRFLIEPHKFPIGNRFMPNLGISRDEAEAVVAYLKWMSAVDSNGFPTRFAGAESSQ